MNGSARRRAADGVVAVARRAARRSSRPAPRARVERRVRSPASPSGRTEAHHDVLGPQERVEPAARSASERSSAGRARLPTITGCTNSTATCCASVAYGAAAEGEQPAAAQEALGHLPAGRGEPLAPRAAKKAAQTPVAREQAVFDARRSAHGAVVIGSRGSADPGQRIAHQHVDDAGAAVGGRAEDGARRLLAHLADHARLLAAGRRVAAPRAPRRPAPAPPPPGTALRWRCAAGRGRAARRRRAPRRGPARAPRTSTIAEAAVAGQLVERRSRRRRASDRASSADPAPPRRPAPRPAAAPSACRSARSASRSSSPRASRMVMPWSPIGPDSSTRSPGPHRRAVEQRTRGIDPADAGGRDVHAVGLAVLDDLGVAADDRHAGPRAPRRPIARTSASSTVGGRPASSTKRDQQRQRPWRPRRPGRSPCR